MGPSGPTRCSPGSRSPRGLALKWLGSHLLRPQAAEGLAATLARRPHCPDMTTGHRPSHFPSTLGCAGRLACLVVAGLAWAAGAHAQRNGLAGNPALVAGNAQAMALDSTVLDARDAARRKDRSRLAAARAALQAGNHPLAGWVDYWDLSSRLKDAQPDEVEAFYARWAGSYVEDRLRNDWLLELGKRRDWAALARDYPRFRMADDRELSCWWLFTEHLAGRDVTAAARTAWLAQKELDDGCNLLATAMVDAKRFGPDEVWLKARLSLENQRPGAARAAVGLLGNGAARDAAEALDNPALRLRKSGGATRQAQELRLLAVMRLAQTDLDAAVTQLQSDTLALRPAQLAWAWAYAGRQAGFKLLPEAAGYYQRALAAQRGDEARTPGWSDDTLAWGVRALLRSAAPAQRWPAVIHLIGHMSPAEQTDPTWVYWRARALAASAPTGTEGDAQRAQAREQLVSIAGPLGFYPQLASDELGQPPALPAPPAAPSAAERAAAAGHPGLARALMLVDLGLRDEARREWNFSLRGMADRELLAAARLACERSDWQLCINTAERSKAEPDTSLRYPMPYAAQIKQAAAQAGLEPALVFGLIRQETRFMPQLRSAVGASGLMQVMPGTAQWVARKIGLDWRDPGRISDPATNLLLGTQYLRLMLDELDGSQAMAAAAYNAGPGRPRRWRDGPVLETAVWAENIPFNETRDYVKKVLSNAAVYSALLDSSQPPQLRPRLGKGVGPRDPNGKPPNTELP